MTLAKQEELQSRFWSKITAVAGGLFLLIALIVDFWLLYLMVGLLIVYAVYKWSGYWKE